ARRAGSAALAGGCGPWRGDGRPRLVAGRDRRLGRPPTWPWACSSRTGWCSSPPLSEARLGLDRARLDRLLERFVVTVVLVGIALGEDGQRAVEDVARPQAACDA